MSNRLFAIKSGRMILPFTVRCGKAQCIKDFERDMGRLFAETADCRAVPVRIVEIEKEASADHA